jgi:hypothetical protein
MWAIGNGESRRDINIDNLDADKVGCNAIMRDYKVEYLVCVDRRMVEEALASNVNDYSLVYTRPEWHKQYTQNNKRLRSVPDLPYVGSERWDEPFQWGSGPYAVLIAAKYTKLKTVSLIGFDLHSKTKTVNNIYKSTPNYDDKNKKAVDPRYWIHQIGMVFRCFPKVSFIIYQDLDWELPKAWKYPNVKVDKISNISYNT